MSAVVEVTDFGNGTSPIQYFLRRTTLSAQIDLNNCIKIYVTPDEIEFINFLDERGIPHETIKTSRLGGLISELAVIIPILAGIAEIINVIVQIRRSNRENNKDYNGDKIKITVVIAGKEEPVAIEDKAIEGKAGEELDEIIRKKVEQQAQIKSDLVDISKNENK